MRYVIVLLTLCGILTFGMGCVEHGHDHDHWDHDHWVHNDDWHH
jgi:hypothetical protein